MAAVIQRDVSSREALTRALDRKVTAEAALEQANEAVRQAGAAVSAVESQLSLSDGLDTRIAAARAELVKRGDSGDLPRSLIEEREIRRSAREKLDECKSALALLEAQQAEAEKAVRTTSNALSSAAVQVILEEVEALVQELTAAKQTVWRLSDCLHALDYFVCGMACPMPPDHSTLLKSRLGRLLQALNLQRDVLPPMAPRSPLNLAGGKWQAVFADLKRNPKAPVRWVWEK